jgi:hypothetical protein
MTEEEKLLQVRRTSADELAEVQEGPKMSKVALLRNTLSISTNIGSVVGIVLVNKIIFSHYNYPFGMRPPHARSLNF